MHAQAVGEDLSAPGHHVTKTRGRSGGGAFISARNLTTKSLPLKIHTYILDSRKQNEYGQNHVGAALYSKHRRKT